MNTHFLDAVGELNEPKAIELAQRMLSENTPPQEIMEALLAGLGRVGQKYKDGDYFVADLIMSGLIFQEIAARLGYMDVIANNIHMLFATPHPDTIAMGKSIVSSYFNASGFATHDIGEDSTPEFVLSKLHPAKHNVLCVSALDDEGFETLKDMVSLFKEKGVRDRVTVLVGGNASDGICEYVGADHYSKTIYDTFAQTMDVVKRYL